MILSYKHKGLEKFARTGSKAGINPKFALRLRLQLTALDVATGPAGVDYPGWNLHPLRGDLAGYWSISVSGNWRVIFRFVDEDVELLDLLDYH